MADDHRIGGADRDGDNGGEFLRRVRRPRTDRAVHVGIPRSRYAQSRVARRMLPQLFHR